ncbi:MAG: P-loop NTPase fold protein [Candidatus Thiodiazotropha sp.]
MADQRSDTTDKSEPEIANEKPGRNDGNIPLDSSSSMNEQVHPGVSPTESDADPQFTQTAQYTKVSSLAESPDSTPRDGEAEALLNTSYRIVTASKSKEYHSYSSLLVACMIADNPASRWFRRRLSELKVKPAAQKEKLGLTEEELTRFASDINDRTLQTKALVWTQSARDWLATAYKFAQRRSESEDARVTARDLVAAFVFARNFHTEDRKEMGLDPANKGANDQGLDLVNGFMSFVLLHHAHEYAAWSTIFNDEFGVEPAPDIGQGPATRLSSDSWTTDDRLGYRGYARAIRHFLLHPQSKPPLSISIQAPWGAGKTSLMRMVQEELDPKAVEAARAGGWKALNTNTARRSNVNALNLGDFLKMISSDKMQALEFIGGPPKRYTVWFNAWKYESGDQLWAGLATAIIDQLTARMQPLDREKFLLRLQASRIDPAKVRSCIYELALSETLTGLRNVWLWLRSAIPLAIGGGIQLWATTAGLGASTLPNGAVPAGIFASMLWAAAEVFILFGKKKEGAKKEPVSTTLGDIVSVPDYDSEIGFTHKVVEDLQHIFDVLRATDAGAKRELTAPSNTEAVMAVPSQGATGNSADTSWPPIVIFIDDLDRCSPRKVADAVEGVNMFLAGDFMPCMFVIGMDPQMVSAALEKAHQDITTQLPGYDHQTPLGWRFMDKFVQLPFTIPPPGPDKLGNYTDHLLHSAEVETFVEECEEEVRRSADKISSPKVLRTEAQRVAAVVADRRKLKQTEAKAVERVLHNSFALRLQDKLSENFSDSQPVVQEMLREAAQGFSSNPRDIKRLLNIVRFEYLLSRTRVADDQPIPDAETMGRWIQLSLRWPAFVRWLQWSPQPVPGMADQMPSGGIVRLRLETLERLCREQLDFEKWRKKVHEELQLREGDVQWDADPALHEFLADAKDKPLSAGAGLGFY